MRGRGLAGSCQPAVDNSEVAGLVAEAHTFYDKSLKHEYAKDPDEPRNAKDPLLDGEIIRVDYEARTMDVRFRIGEFNFGRTLREFFVSGGVILGAEEEGGERGGRGGVAVMRGREEVYHRGTECAESPSSNVKED